MPSPLVISVVLNTNHREDTLQCLTSLTQNDYDHHKIILLDNASSDGTVEAVRSLLPAVQIIELQHNLGYAGNNNVGIQAAMEQGADWIFILNEDTVLAPDCIRHLVTVGESHPAIGIVGPMVYHHNEPDIIQSAGGIITKYWGSLHLAKDEPDTGQYQEPHPVDWISGCAILLRRAVIEQVGMLDERFFYYWEETEWCVRTGKAGWKLMHVPQSKIWHKGVQRDYQPKPSLLYYATRNHLLMLYKHHAPWSAKLYTWFQIARTLTSWTVKPKWRAKREHRNAMWRGVIDFTQRHWGQMP